MHVSWSSRTFHTNGEMLQMMLHGIKQWRLKSIFGMTVAGQAAMWMAGATGLVCKSSMISLLLNNEKLSFGCKHWDMQGSFRGASSGACKAACKQAHRVAQCSSSKLGHPQVTHVDLICDHHPLYGCVCDDAGHCQQHQRFEL